MKPEDIILNFNLIIFYIFFNYKRGFFLIKIHDDIHEI